MYEKISKWLDLLARLVDLIRPKSYNTIAKLVVFTGVGLIVESEINFLHALAVALFEQYLGQSEFLREVLIGSDDPTLGIVLVITGMAYHLVVTLGKDFIQNQKEKLPQFPELIVSLSTQKKPRQNDQVNLDNPILKTPQPEDIPDFNENKDAISRRNEFDSLFSGLNDLSFGGIGEKVKVYTNTNFYRQRADIINKWSGFEPLELHLSNQGKILANGVRIQVILPKNDDCLSIFMPNNNIPSKPKKTYKNQAYMIPHGFDRDILSYQDKMRIKEENDCYKINWDIDTLQAGVITTGNKKIFLRVKKAVEINCTVFCDELSEPKSSVLTITPSDEKVELNVDDIITDKNFDTLYSQLFLHTT
jgi:hypothetical protein